MRTCAIKAVYGAIVRRRSLDPASAGISAAQAANMAELITDRVRRGWEDAFWPQVMAVEQRQYRASWDVAGNYSAADEVYYEVEGEGAYYASLQDGNVGQNPVTETDWWEEVGESFLRTIEFEQDGESPIGAVDIRECVYDRDPRVYEGTAAIWPVELLGEEILVRATQAPLKPYIRFRPSAPEFSLTEWDAAQAYAIGDLCYLAATGETYKALIVSTNKSPDSETTYWEPVPFPLFLRPYVVKGVTADLMLEEDGKYKEEGKAEEELETLQSRLVDAQVARRAEFRR